MQVKLGNVGSDKNESHVLSVDSTKIADILAQILVTMLRNIVLVLDAMTTRRNTQIFL